MEEHEQKIRQNFIFLAENTSSLEPILDIFIRDRILTRSDREEILSHTSWKRKCAEFYSRLVDLKGNICEILVNALRETLNEYVADILDQEVGKFKPSVENIDYFNFVRNGPGPKNLETWNVPSRRKYFTGRERIISEIEILLSNKTGARPSVIGACCGLGGVGKTSLAIEYTWRNLTTYKFIVWFNADSLDLLLNQYIQFGRDNKILEDPSKDGSRQNQNDQVRKVKHWFEDSLNYGWLIVCDNVNMTQHELTKWLPVKGGDILVTSRYAYEWGSVGINIPVFTTMECKDYFKKVQESQALETDEEEDLEILIETLGRLPLALSQACAYIKKNRLKISRYLQLYKEKKMKMLTDKTILPGETPTSVFFTWDLSLDSIKEESVLSSNWLVNCGYLFNKGIPHFLLERFASNPSNNPDGQIFEEAFGVLNSYSMMNVDGGDASVHCLVQDVIRLKFKDQFDKNTTTALTLLDECFPRGDVKNYKELKKKRVLLPHLEIVKSHLIEYVERQKNNDEEGTRTLKNTLKDNEYNLRVLLSILADGYADAANYAKQLEVLNNLLAMEEASGTLSSKTIHDIGIVHGRLGDPKMQLEFLAKAKDMLLKTDHFEKLRMAELRTNLGKAYGEFSEYDKMKIELEESLAIFYEHFGENHIEIATTLLFLAECEFFLGEFTIAKEHAEKCLKIVESTYKSEDHPQRGYAFSTLGSIIGQLGDINGSTDLLRKALSIFEKHFGSSTTETALIKGKLANQLGRVGNTEEQINLLENALKIFRENFKPDHPTIAKTLLSLATAYQKRKNWAKSIVLLNQALEIQEKYHDPNSPQIAIILEALGPAYACCGDTKKNIELLERVLGIMNQRLDPDHSQVAMTTMSLATAYGIDGQHTKHKDLLESALPNIDKTHPIYPVALSNLAMASGNIKNFDKKCELLNQALELNEEIHGIRARQTITSTMELAQAKVECQGYGNIPEIAMEIYSNLSKMRIEKQKRKYMIAKYESLHSTPMHIAAALGHLQEFQRLLDLGSDVMATNDHETILHAAVLGRNIEIVRLILSKVQSIGNEIYVNSLDNDGDTPLAWAAEHGLTEILKCLIEEGAADINTPNHDGKTPLDWAIRKKHFDIAQVLLKHSQPPPTYT